MNLKLTFDAINEIDLSTLSKEELEKVCLRLKIIIEKILLENNEKI